jgi:hypothetical protein
LFVGSKAAATLDHVNFTNDGAIGGAGYNASSQAQHSARTRLGQGGSGGSQGSPFHVGGNGHSGGFGGGGGGGGGSGYFFYDGGKPVGTIAGDGGAGGKGGFGAGNGADGKTGATRRVSVESHIFTNTSGRHTVTSRISSGTANTADNGGGAGGGGLGAGGDIFVQGGGKLKVLGGSLGAGTVKGGSGANPGSAFGSGIFLQANEEVAFAPKAGESLTISGVIADQAGSESGYSADEGTIAIEGPGEVILDATNTFQGGIVITEGTLVLKAEGAAGGGSITFANTLATDPTLSFTAADTPTEALANFGAGDVLDITDLDFKTAMIEGFTSNGHGGGTLTITGSQIGTHDPETVNLVFTNDQGAFALGPAAGGGTDVMPLCYVRGSNILAPSGNVPVESLCIGDLLVTRFGGIRPVKWIGRQSYDVRFLHRNPARRPVRIRAGALEPGMPARDLLVSPGHSLLLGETLVLASSLVNGITIIEEPVGADTGVIDYFQIEFSTHDCVIAEGIWAESYADAPGLRAQFHNAADYFARYPHEVPCEDLVLCAPRPERGAELEVALRPAAARAAAGIAAGTLEGFVDMVNDRHIQGWALDTANPNLPVLLNIMLDEQRLGSVLACQLRDDLRNAGKGSGRCAFAFNFPPGLAEDALSRLTVCRAADGAPLAFTDACLGQWRMVA